MALDIVDAQTPVRVIAQLEYADAVIALVFMELKVALAAAERAVILYRQLGDPLGIARALNMAGRSLVYLGRPAEGEPLLRAALEEARSLGNRRNVAFSLLHIAVARSVAGDLDGARHYFAEALSIFTTIGAERNAASVANNLAEAEFLAGDRESALRHGADALATHRRLGFVNGVMYDLTNMAAYLVTAGRYVEARAHAREALDLAREQQFEIFVVWTLQHLAAIAALQPQHGFEPASSGYLRAAAVLGFVDARLAGLGAERQYTEQQEYDCTFAFLGAMLGADRFAALMAAGATMSEEEAIDQALIV